MHQVFDERRQKHVTMPEIPKTPETFILKRTEKNPLKFRGVKIAETGRNVERPGRFDRWYEMALYQLEDATQGKYIVEIAYRTNIIPTKSAVDESYYDAEVCQSAEEVWKLLDNYNATEFVVGVPEMVDDAKKKNRRIREQVQKSFDDAFADLQFQAAYYDENFAEEI